MLKDEFAREVLLPPHDNRIRHAQRTKWAPRPFSSVAEGYASGG